MGRLAPFTRVSTPEPLEARLLLADVYVNRPEVLSPPQPEGGGQTVLSAGAIDRVSDDGTRTTVVSGLHHPTGLALDPDGNLYYIDVERSGGGSTLATLFRRGADGAVVNLGTVFNSGEAVFSIGSWAFDATPAASGVYVNRPQLRSRDDADVVLSSGSIEHVAADGTRTTVVGGLHHPSGVAAAPDGSLYFVDLEYGPIRATLFRRGPDGALTDMGRVLETGEGSAVSSGGWSFDPVLGPSGDVFVNRPDVIATGGAERVLRRGGIDRVSPTGRRRTAVRGAHFPSGLGFDAAGNLYYQDVAHGPLRSGLFRARGSSGRVKTLGVVADTTGGFVSLGPWAFSTAVDSREDVAASALVLDSGRRRPAAPGGRGAARISLSTAGTSPVLPAIDLFLSTDPSLDASDTALASHPSVFRLKPGRGRAVKLRFTYPSLAAGDYFLVARVRLTGAGDPDTSNNSVSTATPLRLGAAPVT